MRSLLRRLAVIGAIVALLFWLAQRWWVTHTEGPPRDGRKAQWPPVPLPGDTPAPATPGAGAPSTPVPAAPAAPAAAGAAGEAPAATQPRALEVSATIRTTTTRLPRRWAEPVDGACPEGFPVKAKRRSRLYHEPGMAAYARTIPDRCYRSGADAEADGFTRAKR